MEVRLFQGVAGCGVEVDLEPSRASLTRVGYPNLVRRAELVDVLGSDARVTEGPMTLSQPHLIRTIDRETSSLYLSPPPPLLTIEI